jgi:hypothetical protein
VTPADVALFRRRVGSPDPHASRSGHVTFGWGLTHESCRRDRFPRVGFRSRGFRGLRPTTAHCPRPAPRLRSPTPALSLQFGNPVITSAVARVAAATLREANYSRSCGRCRASPLSGTGVALGWPSAGNSLGYAEPSHTDGRGRTYRPEVRPGSYESGLTRTASGWTGPSWPNFSSVARRRRGPLRGDWDSRADDVPAPHGTRPGLVRPLADAPGGRCLVPVSDGRWMRPKVASVPRLVVVGPP